MGTTSFSQREFELKYQQGKSAYDSGRYRLSIENLEEASKLIPLNSPLGGEVQIWLVNAYEANGESQKAISLCQELVTHPHRETKQQAKQLLYIIKAPKLTRPKEWMTEIPDLNNVTPSAPQYRQASNLDRKIKPKRQIELVDLSTVNNKDNQFLWLGIGITTISIVTFFFL
ncbi:tetratricopeptide repeat protein [Geminocystis sp. CENA526]|uniref:tetratricopeptide repeat protein n=1 Tax=Geminocystis sp. CENA526 TaxID=1355871 RepID=UPI003D6EE3E0